MHALNEYLDSAKRLDRGAFARQYPGLFLLKRPKEAGPAASTPASSTQISYATVATKFDADPFAREWRIARVAKRPNNPFPERISIGRATNCDIVLRVPFVSKVHAHLFAQPDGSFALHNNQPSNSTEHNHRKLEPGGTRALKVGDVLSFGSLDFEVVDGARLFDILRGEKL